MDRRRSVLLAVHNCLTAEEVHYCPAIYWLPKILHVQATDDDDVIHWLATARIMSRHLITTNNRLVVVRIA